MIKREERNIITNNLKSLLNQQTKTRKEIADDIGVKYSTFCDWFRGRTSPDANQVKLLADYFKVSMAEITEPKTGISVISDSQVLDSKTRVTVYKTVECTDGSTLIDTDYEYVNKYLIDQQEAVGFRLNDDSMEPDYHKGDIIIATKVKFLANDTDYLFDICIEDEWFPDFKLARVIHQGNKVIITPTKINNEKEYMPEKLTEAEYLKKYRGIYKIVQLIRNYK